jgi:hypothetical protein
MKEGFTMKVLLSLTSISAAATKAKDAVTPALLKKQTSYLKKLAKAKADHAKAEDTLVKTQKDLDLKKTSPKYKSLKDKVTVATLAKSFGFTKTKESELAKVKGRTTHVINGTMDSAGAKKLIKHLTKQDWDVKGVVDKNFKIDSYTDPKSGEEIQVTQHGPGYKGKHQVRIIKRPGSDK